MAKDTTSYKIFSEVDDIKSNYETSSLEKVTGLYRSQFQVVKMCEYYSDSRYLVQYDGVDGKPGVNLGANKRPRPFYNIVNYRVALAKTATDLDIKDIQIVSDNPKYQVHSMLLNREGYEWMKEAEFSKTLNVMGHTRPKYGGYLVKKCYDEEKELDIQVVKWTNLWTDQNNILGGGIVELHHMSPVDLMKKKAVWDNVIDVLKAHKGMKASDRPTSIDVYETTGEFPLSVFKDAQGEKYDEEDKYTYSLQRYFTANVNGSKFLLNSEELTGEMGDYYEYLAWEDNGYGLGRGVIEDSEEAQVWTNDSVVEENTAMKLAGRAGIITDSAKLGNNVLEHDHGKVYEIETNKKAVAFSLVPGALGNYQNMREQWRMQADNVTSSFNAITGEQPPSGTPYSQTALLNQVATKPFDYKREEWGIHLTKIFDKWVIPYLIKKIKSEHILVSEFSDTELEIIDESFATMNANEDIKKEILAGNTVSPMQQADITDGYKKHIKKLGKKRFIEVPDNYFDDIECKVTVLTTGEQKNKGVILESLKGLMATYVQSLNPATGKYEIAENPVLAKLFNEAVELAGSGVSPVSLGIKGDVKQVAQAPAPAPMPQTQMTDLTPPVTA
jgi:hypothetical protein